MLLSLYASFRWTRDEHYALKMSLLILFLSISSSFIAWYILGELSPLLSPVFFLLFPLWLTLPSLSFPFYAFWIEHFHETTGYEIRFLTVKVAAIPSEGTYSLAVLFLLFMLVNLVGALLGYLISKIQIIREIDGKWLGFFGRFAFGVVILGIGIWLFTYHKLDDSFASIVFGITWLAIIIGEFVLNQ